jgi:hypothetical protein
MSIVGRIVRMFENGARAEHAIICPCMMPMPSKDDDVL